VTIVKSLPPLARATFPRITSRQTCHAYLHIKRRPRYSIIEGVDYLLSGSTIVVDAELELAGRCTALVIWEERNE
jgi:hypothetical protein